MLLPLGETFSLVGLILIGLGCAPVYPCIIHSTPEHFGADKSQAIMMGDSLSADIPAAINAGVDSIFFSLKGKTCQQATYNAASYDEALKLLQ